MTSFFHLIRQVLLGSVPINDKRKYQVIGVMIAAIHFIFTLVFFQIEQHFLFCYNVCVVLFYLSMVVLMEFSSRYTLIFFSTYVEVMLHSTLASLIMGFNWGFMYYTIGLIPTVFYLTYTLPYFKKGIAAPSVASLIIVVCYFTVYALTGGRSGTYPPEYEIIASRMFVFNNLIAFIVILMISVLYAVEIRFMQRNLENKNRVLEIEANHDALTGLLNRRSMNNILRKAAENYESGGDGFCVLMTDIDDFKNVNDTYGHAKGDDVIVNIARILKNDIRDGDIACRFGGEEMLVLIKGDMEKAISVAKKICSDTRKSVIEDEKDIIKVTITIGAAEFKKGDTVRSIIETADKRLYQGKKAGKDRVIWE